MFNLGWGEILLIGVVALIAIGPKELPGVLRTVGQMMAKVRRMANEFQGQFQEALREADIADLKKHADDMASSVSDIAKFDPLAETQRDLEKSLEAPAYGDLDTATPAVPGTEVAHAPDGGATDGAKLPEGILPAIDVPLPPEPAPLTEKDFAIADKAAQEVAAHDAPKQAEGKA